MERFLSFRKKQKNSARARLHGEFQPAKKRDCNYMEIVQAVGRNLALGKSSSPISSNRAEKPHVNESNFIQG